MKIQHQNKTYETVYFPFFLKGRYEGFDVYLLRYPSGKVEETVVFSRDQYMEELRTHLKFLLRHFALCEDEFLTGCGMDLKNDVRALFGLD